MAGTNPPGNLEERLKVVPTAVRSAFKHLDRHEFHRASPVPHSTRPTIHLFGEVEIDQHAFSLVLDLCIINEDAVFKYVSTKGLPVDVQGSVWTYCIAECF